MLPLITPSEVAASDAAAIAAGATIDALVARAGDAVAWAARHLIPKAYGTRVLVATGPGLNGADGRAAATQLRKWNYRVEVIEITNEISEAELQRKWEEADLVIDAMFGVGCSRPLTGLAATIATFTHSAPCPMVLAVDIPSGVDACTGTVLGAHVLADHTVTFQALKPGLIFSPGYECAGLVTVADIGIDLPAVASHVVGEEDVHEWWPKRATDVHKWSSGAVLVVGGSPGMYGAPMLAAQAALHAGAGMVHCAVPAIPGTSLHTGGEVIERALPSTRHGLAPEAVATVIDAATRMRCVVIGPGLGTDPQTIHTTQQLLATLERPLVVDADALAALAADPSIANVRSHAGLPPIVLTPHDGEYSKLMGHPPDLDRRAAAVAAAKQWHAVVVLKGPATVIAQPDGTSWVVRNGSPNLATAGTGDVLSGIIAARIAAGSPPAEAAAIAVWLHGAASQEIDVASDLLNPIAAFRRELDRT